MLYPQDHLAEEQRRQAMMHFDDLHDRMHTEMIILKEKEVKELEDQYKNINLQYKDEIKILKQKFKD